MIGRKLLLTVLEGQKRGGREWWYQSNQAVRRMTLHAIADVFLVSLKGFNV
jgi:hypothetical protein